LSFTSRFRIPLSRDSQIATAASERGGFSISLVRNALEVPFGVSKADGDSFEISEKKKASPFVAPAV
jgi:hypothetical protein